MGIFILSSPVQNQIYRKSYCTKCSMGVEGCRGMVLLALGALADGQDASSTRTGHLVFLCNECQFLRMESLRNFPLKIDLVLEVVTVQVNK